MSIRLLNLSLALAIGLSVTACSSNVGAHLPSGIRSIMSTVAAEETVFGVTAPEGSPEAAIQEVILRGNQQQEQAIATRDPSVMRDTSTDAHFREIADTNQALLDAGITGIRLVNLEWGEISVIGERAVATTWETWATTFPRGGSDQSRDRNVYVLVHQAGLWKIQTNEHPGEPFAPSPGLAVEAPSPAPDRDLPSAVARGRSSNWSGYAAVGGLFSGVTGNWTVPEPTADGKTGVSATWVGIGGERSRDLIQAGTQETVSSSGRIRYSAWYEILPAASRPVPLTVRAGDSVTVSINQQEPGIWNIAFINHTAGATYDRTVHYESSRSSAEWVTEAPSMLRGGLLPLSNFGSVRFTEGSTIKDDQTLTIAEAGARPIVMINRRNEALATPSILDSSGAGFSIQREDAEPTVGRRRAS